MTTATKKRTLVRERNFYNLRKTRKYYSDGTVETVYWRSLDSAMDEIGL